MNFYAVIPSAILTSANLSAEEKILYGVISSLTNKEGYCFASNKALSEYFENNGNRPHVKTVSRWVNSLVEKGYLNNQVIRSDNGTVKERRLALTTIVVAIDSAKEEESDKKEDKKTDKYGGYKEEIRRIIGYLNKVTGKSFRYNTDPYVSVIRARFNEGGRTVDDFYKVIEAKSLDPWYLDNPQYFAPTTMFSKSKFDKNLQAWTPQVRSLVRSMNEEENEEDIDVSEEEY